MVNSVHRLHEMKAFMRGKLQEWDCRAGQNNVIVRTDGTLAPCFPMYSATYDWGVAGAPNFEADQLARAVKWVLKRAAHGFQGTTGSFED